MYSLGYLSAFPNLEQLNQKDLGSYDETEAMNKLYNFSPKETGTLARIWLDYCIQQDTEVVDPNKKGEKAKEILSDLLYRRGGSEKTFDKFGFPRILERESQDPQIKSAELEFLVGFAGDDPALQRTQVTLFNSLIYSEKYTFEDVSKYLDHKK